MNKKTLFSKLKKAYGLTSAQTKKLAKKAAVEGKKGLKYGAKTAKEETKAYFAERKHKRLLLEKRRKAARKAARTRRKKRS